MTTGAESGIIKSAVETLLKPFSLILNPLAERIGHWLKRKPKLHIFIHPQLSIWAYGGQGQKDGSIKQCMQIMFTADWSHDETKEPIIIVKAYPQGTTPVFSGLDRVAIPPRTLVSARMGMMVTPILGEEGKDWTGRIVLVDQYERQYKTPMITFRAMASSIPGA